MPGMYEDDAGAVTKRQSVEEIITNIESTKTPFCSAIKDGGKANQILHDFTLEAYPDRPFRGVLDGADVDTFNHVPRVQAHSITQQLREPWKVTQFTEATNFVGIASEKANQQAKAAVLLKFQKEKLFLSDLDLAFDNQNDQANQTRGAFAWLNPTQGTLHPVPADFRLHSDQWITVPTDEVLESVIEAALGRCFDQRHEEVNLFMPLGRSLKSQFDTFTMYQNGNTTTQIPVREYNANVGDKTFLKCVDFLQFSSGTVALKQHSYLLHDADTGAATAYSDRSGLAIDLSQWMTKSMRTLNSQELEDKGGGPRGFWDEMVSLCCLNPLGQFAVYSNAAT